MNALINPNKAGISVTFSAYKVSGGTETPLSLTQNGAVWTSASDLLEVDNPNKTTNTYRIKFVVKNTAGGTGEFIPDAVKVDVIATQVDPMK
jgi:hypothetical protein